MARKSFFTHIKHSVVPEKGNDHHPHLLRREVIVVVLALVVFAEAFALSDGFLFLRKETNLASVLPAVVTDLTNDARNQNSLASLTTSDVLTKAAQDKANDEAAKGYFAHVSPDGTLPWAWFKKEGYSYEYAGENLAVDFDDSKAVVDAWLASPTHRANIMKEQFTQIGIGMATGTYQGHDTIFVVQFFAKPAATAAVAVRDTSSGAAAKVAANQLLTSGVVLGTSTENISPMQKLLASPMTTTKYVLYGLAGLFVLILLLGFALGRRLPRLSATIGALIVIVVALGFAVLNKNYLLGQVTVDNTHPADTQTSKPL